ncbi:CPBP family intramembrane glutamic endopeptidase [Aurantibacillus circumpalustris]|uniref:CPBP family intramembrane glutamic endopeptidase n=1 Tax=Aurantibacillus circumpalustris TaxID=3036359 RepID=UPI00295A9180|nr:CPBP family intramembrane glutamic endopeptidase [Aurantibacillus circumpalustris]
MENELIGALLQVLLFTLIPFLVFIIKNKSAKGFLNYIGLKKSTAKANYLAALACLLFAAPLLILVLVSTDFKGLMLAPESVTGKFHLMGFSASSVIMLLAIALLKTALAEEILFRGFIAKRLIALMGYNKGNFIQAFIFGLIHAVMVAAITTYIPFLILIFILPAIGSYISVYLNEKIGNGSIIPGWISHGLANIIAYSVVGFLL